VSAVNIAVSSNGTAFILTDSLAYRLDRRIDHYATKAHSFPHARAVITVRGNVYLVDRVLKLLKRGADFDEMTDLLRDKAPRLLTIRVSRALRRLLNLNLLTVAEICIVGYSVREDGIRAIGASSSTERAFDLFKDVAFLAPGVPPTELDEVPKMSDDEVGTWPILLLRIMELQRLQYLKRPGAEIIGGHAVLTTVTKDMITQRVLFRWNDPIGARFDPAPQAAPAVAIVDPAGWAGLPDLMAATCRQQPGHALTKGS
jgi:hypothetical protein